jgi:hypothetical protein
VPTKTLGVFLAGLSLCLGCLVATWDKASEVIEISQ